MLAKCAFWDGCRRRIDQGRCRVFINDDQVSVLRVEAMGQPGQAEWRGEVRVRNEDKTRTCGAPLGFLPLALCVKRAGAVAICVGI
jgi:hypothetical protein